MCNAWNHSPNCTCGWGGDGHVGRTDGNLDSGRIRLFELIRLFESYIIPNARCPVCGASVFFYKSKHGGRVFFDELGPPWTKHPCMDDTEHSYQNLTPAYNYSSITIRTAWQKNDWIPVVVKKESITVPHAFLIERIVEHSIKEIHTFIYDLHETELTKSDLIIFAKRMAKDCFMLAVFDVNGQIAFHINIKDFEQILNRFFNM